MSDEECLSRWEDLHNHVVTQSAQAFVTSFLIRCLRANLEHQGDSLSVDDLDVSLVLPRYRHSRKRLLLVDFEGTMWVRDFRTLAQDGKFDPPAAALKVLEKLAEDPRNEVWLLSGLKVTGALEEVGKAVPKIGIV